MLLASSEPSPFEAQAERHERKILLIAPPVVMAFAFALIQIDIWRMVARTFLSMWIHELGHTSAALLSGRVAIPGPWVTRLGEGRSFFVIGFLAIGFSYWAYWAYQRGKRWQLGFAVSLLVLQFWLTVIQSPATADQTITFFGDGGMMVLGTILVLTFWSRPETALHKGWLRWGFLVIGAFAIADSVTSWLAARSSSDSIPYGEIEGVGHSDPTKMVFDYGWPEATMIRRYLLLAAICGLVIAGRYLYSAIREQKSD